jgi:hypothetical protein
MSQVIEHALETTPSDLPLVFGTTTTPSTDTHAT